MPATTAAASNRDRGVVVADSSRLIFDCFTTASGQHNSHHHHLQSAQATNHELNLFSPNSHSTKRRIRSNDEVHKINTHNSITKRRNSHTIYGEFRATRFHQLLFNDRALSFSNTSRPTITMDRNCCKHRASHPPRKRRTESRRRQPNRDAAGRRRIPPGA